MCMLNPGFNGVGITVAMNGAQFGDGSTCGKCIMATGSGSGLGTTPIVGPIYATIDNLCPECKYGDVDFGLGGDGRWQINWDFVDCNAARGAGSTLPSKNVNLRGRRQLLSSSQAVTSLEPGEMVTKEGIVKIADLMATTATAAAAPSNGGDDGNTASQP